MTHGGQQDPLTTLDRHVVVGFLKAEDTGHATTTRVKHLEIQAQLFEHRFLSTHAHDSLVVAVPLHQGFTAQLWKLVVLYLPFEKFTQQESLLAEPPGIFIVGEKIEHLIAEDRHTAWLQSYDRHTCGNLWLQGVKNLTQQPLSGSKHTLVIERTSATQGLLWDFDLVPHRLQDLHRRLRRLWME